MGRSLAPVLVLREGGRSGRGICEAAECAVEAGEAGLDGAAGQIYGMPNAGRRTVGVSQPTVIGWRGPYEQGGIATLEDELRSGLLLPAPIRARLNGPTAQSSPRRSGSCP